MFRPCFKLGEPRFEMEDGLYSVKLKGFDGVDLPPGGVLVLRNGIMMGGGQYSYFTGSYSAKNGIFKGELVLNQHTPPVQSRAFLQRKRCRHGHLGQV